ncbi:PREDICTED: uncharacterized protein LOC109126417 [Camelina sativa]|uniref:Uncharacterized protein LOC109126417 n=1 Tax=Camelina sativa TaxID=90675 RepID=A0ABM1QFF9_CAMSA|nr:PREDICTED: uncharacterized protein LOC109126417 [Camelina sativa]
MVYKLNKALYGLRQAPRAWNHKLNQILKELNFVRCAKEPALYRRQDKEQLLIVAVYVDDLLVTGSSLSLVQEFKQGMSSKFEMSDLGRLTYYLGIEVLQEDSGITLKQSRYAEKILEETGMSDCNAVQVPMDSGSKLSKAIDDQSIDESEYRRNIGCLRYLIHTRPDLSFAVGILSRYMHNPKRSHGVALKHVLRYLQGTSGYGLTFKKGSSSGLVGYCDSSLNIDEDDGKSTSGHIFYLNNCPITWCSQKQETVALSSCEELKRVTVRIDNKSAIALTKNPVFHGRSKHIHRKFHFVRECVENELVEVEYVPGIEQKADILTKALGRIKFKEQRSFIGVQDLSEQDGLKLTGDNVSVSLK